MSRTIILALLVLLALPQPARADAYGDAELAYSGKQWVAAITALRPLVQQGDARAAFLLGKMYLDGNGVMPNPVTAMELYRQAAAKGHTDAMVSIGAIYQAGIGYKRNAKTANEWYGRAARAGSQYAAFIYGVSLFEGDTTGKTDLKPDAPAAYKWFRIAATTGTYMKVKEAANAAAETTRGRLKSTEAVAIEKEVATWQADTDLGPLPALTP